MDSQWHHFVNTGSSGDGGEAPRLWRGYWGVPTFFCGHTSYIYTLCRKISSFTLGVRLRTKRRVMEITTDIKAQAHLDAGFSMRRKRALTQKEWDRLQKWKKENPDFVFKRGDEYGGQVFFQYSKKILSGMYFTTAAKVDLMQRKRKAADKLSNYAKKIGTTKETLVARYKKRLIGSAKTRKINFAISDDEMLELYGAPCFYCGFEAKPNDSLGIDRLNADTGYTYDNSVACCKWCNYSKQTMDFDTFARHVERIYFHLLV